VRIEVLTLITGEEVLSEITACNLTHYMLKNPVAISIVRGKDGQPNVGLAPFPLHAPQTKDATIDIPSASVVYSYVPAEDFIANYNQIFGSGIVLPKTPQIITG